MLKNGSFHEESGVFLWQTYLESPLRIVWWGPCSNYKDDAYDFGEEGLLAVLLLFQCGFTCSRQRFNRNPIPWAKVARVLKHQLTNHQPFAERGYKQLILCILTRYYRFARAIPRCLQESWDANPSSEDMKNRFVFNLVSWIPKKLESCKPYPSVFFFFRWEGTAI